MKDSDDSKKQIAELKNRIAELEAEVKAREGDLSIFRQQLIAANGKLEGLVGKVADELKIAAQIQKVLVPTEFPNIPGFEFSTKFIPSPIAGGDYFDIFEHEDRMKFGIVLASSNGYGMSALLLSVLLKMTGNHDAKRGLAPEMVIQSLARELDPSLGTGPKGNDRANVFYAVIDRRNLEMTYASAGPVFGGLYRGGEGRDGSGKIERLAATDRPIEKGSFQSAGKSRSLSLEARDRLFVVSPGVLAAKNKSGEAFGEDRLIGAVLASPKFSVHDWRNEILYQVETHAGGEVFPQDLTAVVLEVKDRVIRLAPRN